MNQSEERQYFEGALHLLSVRTPENLPAKLYWDRARRQWGMVAFGNGGRVIHFLKRGQFRRTIRSSH